MEVMNNFNKRGRDAELGSPELEADSPEVKRLRADLLESLEDESELDSASQDLNSFMKSFEEEITASPRPPPPVSGESQPELGFLLEASDDELGIPPSGAVESADSVSSELARVESDSCGLGGELFAEIPSSDSFEFGVAGLDYFNGGYDVVDGLFDYSDLGFGSDDLPWKPETLPAQ